MKSILIFSCLAFSFQSAYSRAAEALPDGIRIQSVQASPREITLNGPFDQRQLLLTGVLETGERIDLTRMVQVESKSDHLRISETGQIRPLQNGAGRIHFRFQKHVAHVDYRVNGLESEVNVSFVRDVAPALSKMGCNAGTCHGSKDGQNGFKLSLRGYDFLFDHRALTDDISARRFNRAAPDQSLMLLKTSGAVAHVGGQLTKPGKPDYELLRSWIADGCKLDLESPRVAKIELFPQNPLLPRSGIHQQMVVLATYTDGMVRDVTAQAFIESGNIEILSADNSGLISVLRRGEAPVLARFEGAYTATTITIMGDRSGFVWNQPKKNNYVDQLVYDKLRRVKVLPSDLCTDQEFVRRVYLDLTGLPPTAEQVLAFLNDKNESKRNTLIDNLIGSRAFVEHWTNKWSDLLQVNRKFLGESGAIALRNWIKDRVASNQPYDEFVHDIITASGSSIENPAAAYWKILRDPASAMENTTHLFLAVRFNCNKCHDHPFEKWTQDQYYYLTSYFAQVARKEDPNFAGQRIGGSAVESAVPLVEVVYDSNQGETKHDRTGEIVKPAFPYIDGDFDDTKLATRRKKLASWIISPENRYFASSYVNRLWGYLLGVGLIEPIDDIRAGNPPTNPELLQALTKDFIDSGFDIQHILRTICRSRVYQHSVRTNKWNADDHINYSHAVPRRLPAEVLFDAIHTVTGSQTKIPGVPAGFRAAELPDVGIKLSFLDDFGRPARESSCECERNSGVVLGPIMKLINGPTVSNALQDTNNALHQLVANESNDEKIVEQLFLRLLARKPTEDEIKASIHAIQQIQTDMELAKSELDRMERDLAESISQWESKQQGETLWTPMESATAKSEKKATFALQDDGSFLVSGTLDKDTYIVEFQTSLEKITGIRLEAMADDSLPAKGPGRAPNGNFVLNEVTLDIHTGDATETVSLQKPFASFSQPDYSVAAAIDGNPGSGWAVAPQFGKTHIAIFETANDIHITSNTKLSVKLHQQYDGKHNVGRFRISVTDAGRPLSKSKLPENIQKILAMNVDARNEAQHQELRKYFLTTENPALDEKMSGLNRRVEQGQNYRITGAQDITWALINSPSFLFNR